ncbi:uncharacterized protein [Mytilus edulis]|uniref:uncharacterized protein n=1 Tax=Mytilus edulis TaxID=6550 RepID=UPI0039F0AF9E
MDTIQCEICFKWLKNKKNLYRHKREIHGHNRTLWNCTVESCPQMFSRRSHIKKHLKKKHGIKTEVHTEIPVAKGDAKKDIENDNTGNIYITVKNNQYSDISEGEFDNSVTPEHIENTEQDADHSEGLLNIDDFMDYFDTEDILDMNNNSVTVDETTKPIKLEIKKKTMTLADGTVEVTRDSLIAYSVNMDVKEINVTDIVEEVTSVVNDYLHNKREAKRQDI